jgi:hypothetical protein
MPVTLLCRMIEPEPWASIGLSTAREARNTPVRWTPSIRFQLARSSSWTEPVPAIPAFA